MKIAVIGGGAAGMMFSTQYKKTNPNDEVFVFEKSQYVAWAGCPTPYYIADELSFNDCAQIDILVHARSTESKIFFFI